jgi:triosephosphate isomerase (TIM)
LRKRIIAGNWKMHTTVAEGTKLVTDLISAISETKLENKTVIIIPPFTHLSEISAQLSRIPGVYLGAQNCHYETQGAYTGEVSAAMLAGVGVKYVIIGHSERRQYFNEDNELLSRKTQAVLAENLTPIYCCGETLSEREAGKHFDVVAEQLEKGVFGLSESEIRKVVIAYEPVWAIGTGRTASPEQAQEIHAHIRQLLAKFFSSETAETIAILYGGSVKPDNAAELFGQQDIDGGLVGGASLKAADFGAIIRA